MERGEGIVYKVPEGSKYVIDMNFFKDLESFSASCSTAIINNKEYLLHNEISFSFKITENKEIDIIGGRHIGTSDFTFSKEEGDNCEEYVEDFHPGLLSQLKEKLKEMKYL